MNCWLQYIRAPMPHRIALHARGIAIRHGRAHSLRYGATGHKATLVSWKAIVVCVGTGVAGVSGVGVAHGSLPPPGAWWPAQQSQPYPGGWSSYVPEFPVYVPGSGDVSPYDVTRPPRNDHDEDDNLTHYQPPPGSNDHDYDDCDTVTPPPHHEAPEPSSLAVLGAAILSLGLLMRRRVACASK